jgi:hypothetical protein
MFISTAILTAWYHFTHREYFYSNLMLLATIKTLKSSNKVPNIFVPFQPNPDYLNSFHRSSQCQISRKPIHWEECWHIGPDGWTDMISPVCASGKYANAPNKGASEWWTNHMQPAIFGFTVQTATFCPPHHNGREPKAHMAWYHCCIYRF